MLSIYCTKAVGKNPSEFIMYLSVHVAQERSPICSIIKWPGRPNFLMWQSFHKGMVIVRCNYHDNIRYFQIFCTQRTIGKGCWFLDMWWKHEIVSNFMKRLHHHLCQLSHQSLESKHWCSPFLPRTQRSTKSSEIIRSLNEEQSGTGWWLASLIFSVLGKSLTYNLVLKWKINKMTHDGSWILFNLNLRFMKTVWV